MTLRLLGTTWSDTWKNILRWKTRKKIIKIVPWEWDSREQSFQLWWHWGVAQWVPYSATQKPTSAAAWVVSLTLPWDLHGSPPWSLQCQRLQTEWRPSTRSWAPSHCLDLGLSSTVDRWRIQRKESRCYLHSLNFVLPFLCEHQAAAIVALALWHNWWPLL